MCWLTRGLLENVTGVRGVLLSLLTGRLFHDFSENAMERLRHEEMEKKEENKMVPDPFLMVSWWVGNHCIAQRSPLLYVLRLLVP